MKRFEWFDWLSGLILMIVGIPAVALCQDAISNQTKVITNSIGMKLVPIPAGRFTMGSPASERGSQEDEVLHKVDLTQDFHLGATEVTEHQWAMVMEEPFRTEVVAIRDPESKRLVKTEELQIKNPKLDSQLPVTGISWLQAMDFCKRLGQLPEERKEGRFYRLPTEAEWEYACRAGTSTAYSFGDDIASLSEYAWYAGNSRKTKPVALKRANTWGLFDMHGNVAEWCHDYYSNYSEDLMSDPVGPKILTSAQKIVRGGSVLNKESQCRSSWRAAARSTFATNMIGVRVVMGAGLAEPKVESVVNSIGQRLVKIPAGRFLMGSDKENDVSERPVHQVVISKSFFLGETEVTQGHWKAVMNTEPWKDERFVTEGADYPATYVNWVDAMEFCARLSQMPGEKVAGRVYGFPTEAQWEYACRGGLTTEFSFGDLEEALDDFAWNKKNSKSSPETVRRKLPNAWGLFDMHGNVEEWCKDGYDQNAYHKRVDGIKDPFVNEGEKRVLRGGSYLGSAFYCRAARRSMNEPDWHGRSPYRGFRVAVQSDR